MRQGAGWFKQYFIYIYKVDQQLYDLQAYGTGSDGKQVLILKSSPAKVQLNYLPDKGQTN